MPRRHIVPTDLLTRRDRYPHSVAAFDPRMLGGKVTAMLDLTASAQSAGEWTSWVDVLNSNPGAINAARRPAVGAAANALPIATFAAASPDAVSVPLIAANNGTTHWGMGMWLRPADVGAGARQLACIYTGTAGASAQKLLFQQSGAALTLRAYATDGNGRDCSFATTFAAATWVWVRADWTSARTGDDKMRLYVGGTQVGSYANAGAGPIPTDLRAATGNLLIGNLNDGVALQAFNGDFGPNVYFTSADLTAGEEAALMNYKRPT